MAKLKKLYLINEDSDKKIKEISNKNNISESTVIEIALALLPDNFKVSIKEITKTEYTFTKENGETGSVII